MLVRQGAVYIVKNVLDPNGVNDKDRPVVLISKTQEAEPSTILFGACVTSQYKNPIPDDRIEMPFANDGTCNTGLSKRCQAVGSWIHKFQIADIKEKAGYLSSDLLGDLMEKVPLARGQKQSKPE